jgi:hypothetical protein
VPFLAFEWIEADDLAPSLLARVRERVAATGAALSPRDAFRVLDGVMRGLDWVHQHGLLHRGITASNVLVVGRGETLIAKVTDTAIARPAGLPATFGLPHASTAIAFDAPYRAPEQADANAALTPACDVYAFGALTRFALTGRATTDEPIARAEALHPAFAANEPAAREALASIDHALAMMRQEAPDARPATVHSAWDLLSPALRVLAARVAPSARASLPPSTRPTAAWMWTERHRPAAPRAFRAIATDAEGHALATDGVSLAFFDGRAFRSLDVPELMTVDTLGAASAEGFIVAGRTRLGAARLFRVTCEGTRALPLDASGTVVAAALDGDEWLAIVSNSGRNFAIDARGRVPLEGVNRITLAARFDALWILAGEGDAAFVATLDPNTRLVRLHGTPLRRAPAALVTTHVEAFLGGHHGVVVALRRTLNTQRLAIAREQLPTTATPTALAIGEDGALWCAAGSEILVRDDVAYRSAYRDDGSAEVLALAPARRGMLAFVADGRVVEGRTLGNSRPAALV